MSTPCGASTVARAMLRSLMSSMTGGNFNRPCMGSHVCAQLMCTVSHLTYRPLSDPSLWPCERVTIYVVYSCIPGGGGNDHCCSWPPWPQRNCLGHLKCCSTTSASQLRVQAIPPSSAPGPGSFQYPGQGADLCVPCVHRLKEELSWQGSGFPTLKRDEIKFVQASIEYQKGNKILEDAEFDALKTKILSKSAKRSDVTALLLAVKGQEMLDPEEYEKLKQDMINLGIDVGLKGASCTLSNTSEELNTDFESLLIMYGGLSALPFLGGSVIWWLANLILPGDLPVSTYFGFVGLFTATIVTIILNVAELWNGSIYAGQCPCCESKVSAFFGSTTDSVSKRKCQVCGTALTIDSNSMKLSLQDGPKYLA
mmetsp:Transcript_13430/g.38134  ORF Transcript_13430/g.38134 Transcript_13430/m.38134 type:complete len:368 (-) Transcript_13430:218-1321(-)